MRAALTLAICAILGGCATMTPSQVRESGLPYTKASTQPPSQAAACVARQAGERSSAFMAQQHAGPPNEVLVYGSSTQGLRLLAVAQISPSGTGSTIDLRVTTNMLLGQDDLAAHLLKGC